MNFTEIIGLVFLPFYSAGMGSYVVHAFRSGVIHTGGMTGPVNRRERPVAFWFHTIVAIGLTCFTAILAVGVWFRLVRGIANWL